MNISYIKYTYPWIIVHMAIVAAQQRSTTQHPPRHSHRRIPINTNYCTQPMHILNNKNSH